MLSGPDPDGQPPPDNIGASAFVGAYGASIEIVASDGLLLKDLLSCLPYGWARLSAAGADSWRFQAVRVAGGFCTVDGAGVAATWPDVRAMQAALREELRRYVGFHTPDLFFVHAGVVAWRDAVIVLPGHSFAGKSTLVRALVRAGAGFYSDEFAIFDRRGRVIQYRDPLIMRGPDGRLETEIVAEGPDCPLPVSLVAVTRYREGAIWDPRRVSRADGIVALIEHVSRGRKRPAATLGALKLGLADATVLVGERGEADATAAALLEAVDRLGSVSPSDTEH